MKESAKQKKKEWLMQDIGFSRVFSIILLQTDGQRETHIYFFFFIRTLPPNQLPISAILRKRRRSNSSLTHCSVLIVYFSSRKLCFTLLGYNVEWVSACVCSASEERPLAQRLRQLVFMEIPSSAVEEKKRKRRRRMKEGRTLSRIDLRRTTAVGRQQREKGGSNSIQSSRVQSLDLVWPGFPFLLSSSVPSFLPSFLVLSSTSRETQQHNYVQRHSNFKLLMTGHQTCD